MRGYDTHSFYGWTGDKNPNSFCLFIYSVTNNHTDVNDFSLSSQDLLDILREPGSINNTSVLFRVAVNPT